MHFTSKDHRFFAVAATAARTSHHYKAQIGAVLVGDKEIVSVGVNDIKKTHPLQKKYNEYRNFNHSNDDIRACLHAEINAIIKAKRLSEYKHKKIYVVRVKRDNSFGIARPCPACIQALISHNVREVFYTTDTGIAFEEIGC